MTTSTVPTRSKEEILADWKPHLPEERPTRASDHCRHYGYRSPGMAGLMRGDHGGPTCAVGCDNRTAPGASSPCMPPRLKSGDCAQREDYTSEERAEWDAWMSRHMMRSVVAMSAIPAEGWDGEVDCPACGAGKIRWARARSNRHLHAACSTPRCFAIMQ